MHIHKLSDIVSFKSAQAHQQDSRTGREKKKGLGGGGGGFNDHNSTTAIPRLDAHIHFPQNKSGWVREPDNRTHPRAGRTGQAGPAMAGPLDGPCDSCKTGVKNPEVHNSTVLPTCDVLRSSSGLHDRHCMASYG